MGIVKSIRLRVLKLLVSQHSVSTSSPSSSSNSKIGTVVSSLSCLELYGGVGTIGLNLHDLLVLCNNTDTDTDTDTDTIVMNRGGELICSDENPGNVKCFYKSVNDIIRIRQKSKIHKQKEIDEISKKVVVPVVPMIEDDNRKDENVEEEKKIG